MQFYYIENKYVQYLSKYDSSVADNKNERRPYVGVVVEIESIKYYAPFTSPKPKHQKMKNGKDFRKIAGGKLGAINFNNMIPVPDVAIKLIDIANEPDEKYRNLLRNQFNAIRRDASMIEKTARSLRDMILTADEELSEYEKTVKERCCNLSLLESVFLEYRSPNIEDVNAIPRNAMLPPSSSMVIKHRR